MSLKNLNIKSIYRKKDDVLNSFYIPVLKEAASYKRVSAYFSSDVLKLYSKGLASFVKSNGKIRFIFSHHISEEDYNEIKKGYDARYDGKLLQAISDLDDSIQISNLSYLISKGIVEIKFGFVSPGTLHFKFGLVEDETDVVCFRGSTNETPAGLLLNGENFEVSCSWLASERDLSVIQSYKKDFKDLWNGQYEGVVTVDAPQCVINFLSRYSKNNLILDYEDDSSNSFVFDLDEELKLVGYSFLYDKNLLSPNGFFYKSQFGFLVNKIDNLDVFYFQEMKTIWIKKVIESFQKFGEKHDFKIFLSNKLKFYLQQLELHLDKRVSLGNAIKHKDESILLQFEKFKNIVNEELTRRLALPQLWDAFHAVNMIASCNFSVPGTGKTTIAYGAFGYLSSEQTGNHIKRIIMIGPKNSFMSWKNEFRLCFGEKRPPKIFNIQDDFYKSTNQRIASLTKEFNTSNLVLINYDMLLNGEVLDTLKRLMRQDNYSDYLILDEVHKVKGFNGKRAQAVLSLAPLAKYKLLLTGTPIPNSYLDIYNALNILYNDSYNDFFGYSPAHLENASYIPSQQDEINKKIYPFYCRTTKKDLHIPEATFDYETGYLFMDENERKLFSLVYKYFSSNVLVLYIRLLQASINPKMLVSSIRDDDIVAMFNEEDEDEESNATDTNKPNFKFIRTNLNSDNKSHKVIFDSEETNYFINYGYTRKFYKGIEIIESLVSENESVVAWGVFVDTLNAIQKELTSRGIKSIVINGSVPLYEREKIIQDFMQGKYRVLISNPHTLAESVSLHHVCHNAVYFEYTFNLTHFLQSRDRIHRLGLKEDAKTTYYFLAYDNDDYMNNAIDVKTLKRLKMKEDRMLNAIESEQLLVKGESFIEDINFIFNVDK